MYSPNLAETRAAGGPRPVEDSHDMSETRRGVLSPSFSVIMVTILILLINNSDYLNVLNQL